MSSAIDDPAFLDRMCAVWTDEARDDLADWLEDAKSDPELSDDLLAALEKSEMHLARAAELRVKAQELREEAAKVKKQIDVLLHSSFVANLGDPIPRRKISTRGRRGL